MTVEKQATLRYAVCIANEEHEASLERNKVYAVIPDARAEADGLIRVIDEDGEGYLYPAKWFVAIEVPRAVQESVSKAS